jgi:hypothetical protein
MGGTAPRWGPRARYGVPPLNGPFFERPEPFEEVSPPGGQQVPVGSPAHDLSLGELTQTVGEHAR